MFETWASTLSVEVLGFGAGGWGTALMVGFGKTLLIASSAFVLAFIIGMVGACGKLYGGLVVRDLLEVYTTLVRAVPELVLILLLYYAGTEGLNRVLVSFGFPAVDINGLAAGIAVLGIVLGAYMIEVIRGAIRAVPLGEVEAGRAFGMAPLQLFRRIIFPAMLPHALPGLGNYWLSATRDTALLAVVGFTELTLATRSAAGSTRHFMTFYLTGGAIYLALSTVSTIVIKRMETRYRRGIQV